MKHDSEVSTLKSRFNESRFNIKSRFKVQNLMTKEEFHFKKSQFSIKSQFKESKCADGNHSLNRDFIVQIEKVAKETKTCCEYFNLVAVRLVSFCAANIALSNVANIFTSVVQFNCTIMCRNDNTPKSLKNFIIHL